MAPRRAGHNSRGTGDGAILAAQRAVDKEDEYRRSVNKLQAMANVLADRLANGSDVENILKEVDSAGADDFLLSARNRLKSMAESNAKRMLEINYFVEAVKEVRTEVERRRQNENEANEGSEDTEAPNYERLIHDAIDATRERAEADGLNPSLEEHEFSIELRARLGEKMPKKKVRASRGGDDDDDDLEVVNNRVDDVHTLKCPITGMLFEDPVKNKVCHHTYSRSGLNQMIKNRKRNCPVPGCANNNVSLDQVEDDEEMKMKVRRHKTREEAAKRRRELEDDDDNVIQ